MSNHLRIAGNMATILDELPATLRRLTPLPRVALYGLGRLGEAVLHALKQESDIKVIAVIDRREVDFPGIPYHPPSKIEELPSIDAIIVATSPLNFSNIKLTLGKIEHKVNIIFLVPGEQRWLQHPEPSRAAINFLRSRLAFKRGDIQVTHYPWMAYLELSRNCNLRCIGCHSESTRRFEDLPLDQVEALIDEIGPYLYHVSLFRGGETFMHPKFFHILNYLHSKSAARIHISTNLSFRFSDERLEQLVRQCWLIDCCIDGLVQESYGQYRVGGSVDLAFGNLERLVQLKAITRANCQLRWRFVVFRHNEHELDEARRRAKNLGVEFQVIKPFVPDESWQPLNQELWRPQYQTVQKEAHRQKVSTATERPCPWMYGGIVLNHDQTVSPCCELATLFGSLQEATVGQVYNGENFRIGRETHTCNGCEPNGRVEWEGTLEAMAEEIHLFIATHGNADDAELQSLLAPF